VHLHRGALRHVIAAIALVGLALPAASLASTPSAHAASAPTHSIAVGGGTCVSPTDASCYVSSDPAIAFNLIGNPHTVTFTCGAATAPPGLTYPGGILPGCYDVTASVTDETSGAATTFTSATCGGVVAPINGSSVNCSSVASPLNPNGVAPPPGNSSTASVTINPGAPHAYLISWTGYTGTIAGTCPAGMSINASAVTLTTATGGVPGAPVTAPAGTVCMFTVESEKKYVEINKIVISSPSGSPCAAGAAAATLIYSEAFKAYFGPGCTITAVAYGTVVLKTGVDCTSEPGYPSPVPAPAEYGAGAEYTCTNNTLSVIMIPSSILADVGTIPLTYSVSGLGGFTLSPPGGLCTASGYPASLTTYLGNTVYFCPTGPGGGSIQACITGPINSQPSVCSNTLTFTYILPPSRRVVPYVRWAGEKQVLTKCFGLPGIHAGDPVEFTLTGGGAQAQAALIPVNVGGSVPPGGGNSGPGFSDQSSVWTITDNNGCASVILFAASEGEVVVDASLYEAGSVFSLGTPIINEHVFDVFYLKFDHIDIENIKMTSYANTTLTTPVNSLAFSTTFPDMPTDFTRAAASFSLPNAPGTNPPGAAGYSVPLCLTDLVRAMVHGYFEIPGDPSGRPATSVTITGAPSNAAGSYVLPAGRWVLPEDWPVLATFAGYTTGGSLNGPTPNSVYAWDLNSGWVFNTGNERALLCTGPVTGVGNNIPAAVTAPGTINNAYGDSPASGDEGTPPAVSYGPCFSADQPGTNYQTAETDDSANCEGGATVGIGPFDPTQSCTAPFPLTFTPSGGGDVFGGPVSANSTYLPNGTLNEWDTPMPAAEISFGVNSGPGYLAQVNKTGLYAIPTACSAGAAGSFCDTTTGTFGAPIYPDPFYATAIPPSPLIPPVTNNGGYLWDTFGPVSGPVYGTLTSAGFVAGESDFTGGIPANTCYTANYVYSATPTPGCYVANPVGSVSNVVTSAQCTSLNGVWTQTNPGPPPVGTCYIAPAPTTATMGAGLNTTDFGSCSGLLTPSNNSVTLVSAAGFVPGMTVEVYQSQTFANGAGAYGTVLATNLQVTGVSGNTVTFNAASIPAGLCIPAYQGVFLSQQLAITASGNNFTNPAPGTSVTLVNPSGNSATTTVAYVVGGTIYLNNAAAIAIDLAGCTLSNPVGTCEPATFLPAGSFIYVSAGVPGPTSAADLFPAGGQGPYPFWQWLPESVGTGQPRTATVYSDNHGEAIVALQTGVASQVAPVAGVCPSGYYPAPTASAPLNCILNYATLGTSAAPGGTAFSNISAASTFSASSPGCITTTAAGGTTPTTQTNPVVGATGPTPGQICINSLGGIEFGANATLGTTVVQAVADYPYTRGLHPPVASGALTKIWTSAFNKSLTVSPIPSGSTGCTPGSTGCGLPGPNGTTTYTVTITATDICGNPVYGEPVNVFLLGNAGAAVLAPTGANAIVTGTNTSTVFLDATGTAVLSLEILNTAIGTQGLVVKAVFPLERVERFVTVVPGTITGQTTTVLYTPGYNQVGGPPGSNFSSAEGLFSWDPVGQTYTNATASAANISSAAPSCTGYWAYFAAATAVNLPATSTSGQTAACSLAAGWNLVGNPFSTPAALPSGTTAYHWNGSSYDTVGSIPVGGAVWIFEAAAATVTLTAT